MNRSKKQNNNDYFLMLSAVLLLIATGSVVGWFSIKKESIALVERPKFQIIGNVVFTIDFGSGKKRSFEGDIVKGEAPTDALSQASKAGSFSYKFDEKSNLAAVDNFTKNSDKSWRWYLNGEKISKPYEISLHANDKILIKYE